jgi:hypothetical protein
MELRPLRIMYILQAPYLSVQHRTPLSLARRHSTQRLRHTSRIATDFHKLKSMLNAYNFEFNLHS